MFFLENTEIIVFAKNFVVITAGPAKDIAPVNSFLKICLHAAPISSENVKICFLLPFF